MKYIIRLLIILTVASPFALHAQDTDRLIQKGNELYKQQKYREAELVFNEVLQQDPNNNIAKYNKAITAHRQNKPDESLKSFEDLAFKTENKEIREKSYYNKGSILSGQKKLEESIEAYKSALRQDPNDKEARENLQKALLELKKKNPPKKNDKQKQNQQKQQQKPQPKMNQKEAEQRLKLLEQKEREVQQRLQKEKSKSGGGQPKDW
jgi:tetratricopeptide (TPR) repeat protein